MNEKTISSKTVFEGRVLDLEVLDVELDSGVRTTREVVRHKGAVAVLAVLPDGKFLFVRQFRKPVESAVMEIVAGILEKGEEPAACAAREVKEETGYDITCLVKLGEIWPTPGYSSELVHVFHAKLSADSETPCPEEDEHLEPVLLDEGTIEKMVRDGDIRDAKTLSAWCMWKNCSRGL